MQRKWKVGRDRLLIVVVGFIALAVVGEIGFLTFGGLNIGGDPEPDGDSSPSWSADSTKITFSSDETGDYDIYVMNADRTEPVNLTNREARDTAPAWSPDGEWIVFLSRAQGKSDVHRVRPDGSGLSNLTVYAAQQYSAPVWSPDGSKIAFTSNREADLPPRTEPTPPPIGDGPAPDFPGAAPQPELYIMNADGSGQTRLTYNLTFDGNPSWAPDGRQLAFQSRGDKGHEIYVINVDGTGLTKLTDNEYADLVPAWSPDGRYIAFTSNRNKTEFGNALSAARSQEFTSALNSSATDYDIYIMKPDGSDVFNWTQISDTNDSNPSWSPDSEWIAYDGRYNLGFSLREGVNEIYLMRLEGLDRNLTKLTSAQTVSPNENVGPVVWSPDGKNIAFVTARDGTPRIQAIRVFRPS